MTCLRAVAVWMLILIFAIANGLFRDVVLLPRLALPLAFVTSSVMLSLIIFGLAFALSPRLKLTTPGYGLSVGSLWLGLTLLFEFGFGGWVQGRSWEELLQAHTFENGNVWPLVLLATFLAPVVAQRMRYGK
jgi:hypothetical protein